jgi:predicted dehydrogenase/threonine dehydrogenase-like Zn-dependent dehydrogenase
MQISRNFIRIDGRSAYVAGRIAAGYCPRRRVKQIIQTAGKGRLRLADVPDPIAQPQCLLVAHAASLISAGTERYVVELARKSLVGKALARPDHVRRILEKIRQEGLFATLQQVRAKLDEPMALGYSAAGVVLECGRGVQDFKPGDRVATAAPHAEIASIGRNLCARIPDAVTFEQAAYTSVAAIALEGVRLSEATLGSRVLVIGLGLVGLTAVALLKAQGCRVYGMDVDAARLDLGRTFGLDGGGAPSELAGLQTFGGPSGVDAVLITAATDSNEPIEIAAEACRPKGRIVLVGVAGLQLPRAPFFKKELEFTVSSSLGPGRGDPSYEEKGVDYPIGHARWTARRNMETVLELMAAGKLPVESLTSHRFPVEQATAAYDLITKKTAPHLGVLLQYSETPPPLRRRMDLKAPSRKPGALGVSMIGAGNYARLMLIPALLRQPQLRLRGLCAAGGLHAEHAGRASGFEFAATDAEEILKDPDTSAVFIATRHDLHAPFVLAALRAGKHVFVEKPLCIKPEELREIAELIDSRGDGGPILCAGFNRRFAPATSRLASFFKGAGPLSVHYRFSSGSIPGDHWVQDEEVGGGRLVGEACHAIDWCVALTGSPIVRVFAESVRLSGALQTSDDRAVLSLRHEDGSVSVVSYQAGGDRAAPPERIEVFGGGRTALLEAWDRLELWKDSRCTRESAGKDKGHGALLGAFLKACREGGSWPIPWGHLLSTSWASLMAPLSLRQGVPLDRDQDGP